MNNNTLIETLFEIGSTIRIVFADKKEINGKITTIAEDALSVKISKEQTVTLKKEDIDNIISCQIVDYPSYFFSPIESPLPGMLPARGRIIFLSQGKRNEFGRSQPFGMIADNQSQTAIFFNPSSILDDVLYRMNENEIKGQLVTYFIKKGIENRPQAVAITRPMAVVSAIDLAEQVSKYPKSILDAHALLQVVEKYNTTSQKLKTLLNKLSKINAVKFNKYTEVEIINNLPIDESQVSLSTKEQSQDNNSSEFLQATGEITHFFGNYGYILSNHESYYFSKSDILDSEILPQLQDFLKPSRFRPKIPIVCSFEKVSNRASSIFRPLKLAVFTSELVNMLKRRRMKEAKELLDIIKVQFPANPKILGLEQQYDEIISFQSSNRQYDVAALKPCGFIVGTPVNLIRPPRKKANKESVHFARIGDRFLDNLTTKTKYHISDILDEQYKSRIKENDPVLYQLIEEEGTKEQRIFRALFIVPLRPIGELLLLAENKYEERNFTEAWGIAKNIIDQIPNNYEAKRLIESCEKECIEVPNCLNIHRYLFRARNYLSERNYEQSIKYYQRSQIVDLNQEVFIRPMIDCYRNLLSQTVDIHKRIRVRAQYVIFCEKYLNLLDLTKPDNLQCQIDYYNEIDNFEAVIDVYKKKLSQLATKNDYESIAITYANIAEEYLLSSLPNNLDNAIININCALRVDHNCKKALRYREVIALSALIRNKALGEQQYKSFEVNDLLQTKNQDMLPAKEESSFKTIEYERFAVVLEISKTKDPYSICGLICRYLLTFQYSTANEYLSQAALVPSKPLHKVLFFVEKLCDIIDNGQEVLAKIRSLSLISSSATALLAKVLWEYDWRTACSLVTTTQLGSETSFVRYGLELSKQRELWWKQIEQLSIIRDSLISDFSIQKFIDFIKDIDITLLSDTFVTDEINLQLLPLCQNYILSTNTSLKLELEGKILELTSVIKTLIDRRPTLFSFSIFRPLTSKLSTFINDAKARRVLKTPTPSVKIICASGINPLNEILIEVEIRNFGTNVYPIKVLSLTPEDNANLQFLHRLGSCKAEELAGQEFEVFHFNAKVISNEDLAFISCNFKLVYSYDNRENNQTCSLTVPITRTWKPLKNPYSGYGVAVQNEEMFFGRQDILDEIYDTICPKEYDTSKPLPTSQYLLYGQKRCGKSSVLFFLKKRFNNDSRLICIDVDFIDIITESDCYKKIINRLYGNVKGLYGEDKIDKFELPPNYNSSDCCVNVQDFRRCLASFKNIQHESIQKENRTKQIVLLIDEFSSVFKLIRTGEISPNFIETWRSLFTDESTQFSAVLICKDVMPSIIDDYGNKNVFGAFTKQRLNYLLPEYARELICKPIISKNDRINNFYHDGAVDRILYYTACSAFYTYFFCCFLIRYANKRRLSLITKFDVDIVAEEVAKNIEQADGFDAILKAGEDDNVSSFPEKTVKSVMDKIADLEIQNPQGCYLSQIKNIYNETNVPEQEYLETVIKDLTRRDVVDIQNNKITIKIKLYLLWHQYQQVSNLI